MTERDQDYERWQMALQGLTELSGQYREVSGQYQQLLKSVQTGFGFLSDESAATARRLTRIEAKIEAMDMTLHKLLPHMAAIAAYVVAQEQRAPQPQPRPRQTRRANGE
jgi:hypothetical protein